MLNNKIRTMEAQYILGVFDQEEQLLAAFRRMKKEAMVIEDVFTPYPVHEVLENHGRKSRITIVGWFYGVFATLGVLAFLVYTAVLDWPLNYGGKPSSAFPSFLVVTIILTIFSITILSLFTFSWRANLWPSNEKPIFHDRATDDKFVILLKKENVDPGKATLVFRETGASEIIEK
jgi:Alternative complex III, ActD subunit